MKKIFITSALAALALMPASAQKVNKSSGGYPITPVPFTSVKVWNNSFWGQRIETSRKVTIPLAFSKCETEGRYKNFERAAHPSESYDVGKLMPYSFDDTDPYKTIGIHHKDIRLHHIHRRDKIHDAAALIDVSILHITDRLHHKETLLLRIERLMVLIAQDGLIGADAHIEVAILGSLSKKLNVAAVQ